MTGSANISSLVHDTSFSSVLKKLDERLRQKLEKSGDRFLPGLEYIKKWGYRVDETGTVPYTD